jgi:hypothetical protein
MYSVTLELPEHLLAAGREAAHQSGRAVEEVLLKWLERGAAEWDNTFYTQAHVIYTPVGSDGTAEALEAIWREHEVTGKSTDMIRP